MAATLRGVAFMLVALALTDQALGWCIGRLGQRTMAGEKLGVFNLVARTDDTKVLVLGSSRAFCHFDPSALPTPTLNAGMNGQGIFMARIMLQLCPARPDYVLIDPMYFEDEHNRLAAAHHLYGRNSHIDEILTRNSWKEKTKLYSSLYRHAGVVLPAVIHGWREQSAPHARFNPLPRRQGVLAPRVAATRMPSDDWWIELDLLVSEVRARGSIPVIVISPCAERSLDSFFDAVVSRMIGYVKVVDSRNMFPATDRYFVDAMHLNADAAREFSASLDSSLSPQKK